MTREQRLITEYMEKSSAYKIASENPDFVTETTEIMDSKQRAIWFQEQGDKMKGAVYFHFITDDGPDNLKTYTVKGWFKKPLMPPLDGLGFIND